MANGSGADELSDGIVKLDAYVSSGDRELSNVFKLKAVAEKVASSFSGSWLGYHSKVYYKDLETPPPGCHFSSEWGFGDYFSNGTSGEWCEYEFEGVVNDIHTTAGDPDLSRAQKFRDQGVELFEEVKRDAEVFLRLMWKTTQDSYLETLLAEIQEKKIFGEGLFVDMLRPKSIRTRDSLAASQGSLVPPHISVLADCFSYTAPGLAAQELIPILKKAYSYSSRLVKSQIKEALVGTNVFIGHGRSHVWRDLKDFVTERLSLPFDEFNRVPVAGITNIARLSEMLDSAAVAFIVMTAEDEQADGKMEARTNVIHEVGLFQGRLGFTKAIVLLEEGCQEFSNIQGLGQIRFPKGDIKAKFEEIRQVLEREKLIRS